MTEGGRCGRVVTAVRWKRRCEPEAELGDAPGAPSVPEVDAAPLPPSGGYRVLGEDDFALGTDHYIEAAYRILTTPETRPGVPHDARLWGFALVFQTPELADIKGRVEEWAAVLLAVIEAGYTLAVCESWSLDRERALALIEEGLRDANERVRRSGEQPINFDDLWERTSWTARGLLLDETNPLLASPRDYISSQPAWGRLETLLPMADVPAVVGATVGRRALHNYRRASQLAWQFGICLGVLDLLGQVPRSS